MSDDLAKIWNKRPSELTRDDVDQIIAAYKQHMLLLRANGPKSVDPKTGERKKVRARKATAKADPAQLDLEELIAKEKAK